MIKKFLEWLLSFFKKKEEKVIEQRIVDIDDKIEEIDNEDISTDDILDHLNR